MTRTRSRAAVVTAALSALLVACTTTAPTAPPTTAPTSAPTAGEPTDAATSEPTGAEPTAGEPTAAPEVTEEAVQLDFVLSAAYAPLLWGVEQGIFAEHGIDPQITPGDGSELAIQQLAAGNIDFAFMDMGPYIQVRAQADNDPTQPFPATAVYAWMNIATTGIVSREPLEGPEDMADKTFGTVAQSSGRLNIPLILEQNGVEWDPDSQLVLMDFSVLYPTLFSGGVDTAEAGLAGSWEGAYISAQEQGIEVFFTPISEWGFLDYSKVLVVRDEVIENEPERVQAMVAAVMEAEYDALENATPDDIFELVSAQDPSAEEERVKLAWESMVEYIVDPGPMEPEVVQYKLDLLAEQQDLETDLAPEDFYTNEFIPER
jgi:NitT/TauT family transport system substrate-binding protein